MIIEISNIVSDKNQLYLIFQHDYQYSYALKIYKTYMNHLNTKDNLNCFKSNDVIYSVDFNDTIILNNIDEYIIKDMILLNDLKVILVTRKEYKYKSKHGDITARKRKHKKRGKYLL